MRCRMWRRVEEGKENRSHAALLEKGYFEGDRGVGLLHYRVLGLAAAIVRGAQAGRRHIFPQ